jgi:hypothetical protein
VAGPTDAYDKISSTLQAMTLVFIAFLLFTTFFIFLPYFTLANNYNLLQNMLIYTNEINNNIQSIGPTLTNDTNVQNFQTELNNNSMIFYINLSKTYVNVSDLNTQEMIKNDTRISSKCSPILDIQKWFGCNQLNYIDNLKANNSIELDYDTLNRINKNFLEIEQDLVNLKNSNDKSNPRLISKDALTKITDNITAWSSEWKTADQNGKINYAVLDKFVNLAQPLIPTLIIPKNEIYDQIKNFSGKIKDLDMPIVGKVPFDLKETLLSFPIVISIGFSFISIHFKKLMELNKETKNIKTRILSWLDPLQGPPEGIYSWIIILSPAILFTIFNLLVFGLSNNYTDIEDQISKEFLITQDTRIILYFLDSFAAAILILSYILIFRSLIKNRR